MSLYFDEDDAVEELQNRGYRVIKVGYPDVEGVDTIKKLIEFFYSCRVYYNPDRTYPPSIDYQKDSRFASDLVRSRQKLGLSRKDAIRESAMLIDTMFRYEKHLGLSEPIIHLTILTSRSLMDRVCTFLNGEVDEVEETKNQEYIDSLNELYKKRFAEEDLKEIDKERKKILENINERRSKDFQNKRS